MGATEAYWYGDGTDSVEGKTRRVNAGAQLGFSVQIKGLVLDWN